ncbi:MAG TPA: choice-of-anchor J domain-containing protein, partial [Ignavibacteria bacterium]|nr:choice-of-anchor J domain-containing protein [Ignavibacteria bacterium]
CKKNINFNNPFVTYGTELDIPLIVLNESFEGATFPPSGWMKINPDGGTGWNRQAAGTTPIPGWTGGIITAPPLGGTKVAFSTWTTGGAFSNDQWLVTPQIVNSKTDDSLSFWVRFWPSNVYADTVYVKISTTSPTISGFTTDVATIPFPRNSPDTNWTKYTYHIGNLMPVASSYYIAFIEKVDDNFNDGASVSLDLVSVVSTECDPDVPFLTTLDYPGAGPHQEGKVTYQYPWKPDGFIDIHCGLNPNMSVDPCNPWTLVFYAALWEQKTGNDLVKFLPPRFNWNQDSCQWITFDVVYPLNYIPDTYVDSIVMKITMKPKPVTNCTIIQNPVRCDMPPYQYYDPDCWRDCINELLTLEGQDNCSPPNSAICRIEWDKPLPVELTSFTSTVNNNTVTLNWNTGSEKNNARFIVQRMKEGTWNEIGTVAGNGTTNNANSYSFTDKNLYSGIYNYRLKQVDYNGSFEYLNLNGVITIGQPEKFSLSQNYPNPFNPTTTIHFGVPNDGLVTMKIYNLNGREVKTIVNDFRTAGYYTVSFNASDLASGIYYYKLTAGNNSAVNKMVVIK